MFLPIYHLVISWQLCSRRVQAANSAWLLMSETADICELSDPPRSLPLQRNPFTKYTTHDSENTLQHMPLSQWHSRFVLRFIYKAPGADTHWAIECTVLGRCTHVTWSKKAYYNNLKSPAGPSQQFLVIVGIVTWYLTIQLHEVYVFIMLHIIERHSRDVWHCLRHRV